ncbi:flagellar hook-associated protein FlgK [Caulobacter sp. CCUG 60055]|nr:flagellar hook-associated protein FlgK [Caulobacter sp. CCUG 60055]MBQ1541321.1 flagellar hook-associated protein FlgK [Caulobacteraceae bacterium]MCI3182059.1 flagellar hook-associated protein FlgK [Caulobacter sp. CCUG 60055]
MSLNSIMSSATTGLMVSQTGLRVVSDNIANVNTPGYVRKVLNQQALAVNGMGAGVDVASVTRAIDVYLQRASLTASSDSGSAGVKADMLDRAQALFGDPSTNTGFFSRLDQIYSAFTKAGSDTASTINRGGAIGQISDFLSEAKRIGSSLQDMSGEADSRISADVDKANNLLSQINALNGDITRAKVVGADSTGSENVQSNLINQLASLMNVQVSQRATGGVNIRNVDGIMLAGDGAATLSYQRSDTATGDIMVTPAGSTSQSMRMRMTSGEIKGLLDLRDKEIPGLSDQLGEFVSKAVDQINRAHNASSSVPAPSTLNGRNTGLDLPTAVSGFTGKTTIGIVDASGNLQTRVDIDFDAGTMSTNGGPASAFTPGTFLASLNTALGAAGSASFTNGALSLSAAGGSGVAITDDATTPASKTGKGFSHFFGLNDLIKSTGPATYDTGLKATDPNGFTGGSITLRIADADGGRVRDVTVTPPVGGTMQDLLDSLNSNANGVGFYGQFNLDAQGKLAFAPNGSGSQVSVVDDSTTRGPGGPTLSTLFGISTPVRAARAQQFSIRPDITADPMKMALAKFDLTSAAAGKPALAIGDGRGAALMAASGGLATRFSAAGTIGAVSMTVSQYGAEFSGGIGRKAAAADADKTSADSVKGEADTRRSSSEGVSLDQELVQLTTYQQAFNASARMIQATKDLYDSLLGMMR